MIRNTALARGASYLFFTHPLFHKVKFIRVRHPQTPTTKIDHDTWCDPTPSLCFMFWRSGGYSAVFLFFCLCFNNQCARWPTECHNMIYGMLHTPPRAAKFGSFALPVFSQQELTANRISQRLKRTGDWRPTRRPTQSSTPSASPSRVSPQRCGEIVATSQLASSACCTLLSLGAS